MRHRFTIEVESRYSKEDVLRVLTELIHGGGWDGLSTCDTGIAFEMYINTPEHGDANDQANVSR